MSTQDTKKISQALDKSTRALTVASDTLTKTVTELTSQVNGLVKQQSELAQDIEFKSQDLAAIEQETADKVRNANIELEFKVRENEDKVRAELLKKAGKVETTQADLDKLASELSTAKSLAQRTEYEAVADAQKELKQQHEAELLKVKSDHAVQIAQLEAKNEQAEATKSLLEAQIQELKDQIKANRDAEIAKAEANAKAAGVTINNSK